MHALFQAQGDAVIVLMSDLQTHPRFWPSCSSNGNGTPIVIAVKQQSAKRRQCS